MRQSPLTLSFRFRSHASDIHQTERLDISLFRNEADLTEFGSLWTNFDSQVSKGGFMAMVAMLRWRMGEGNNPWLGERFRLEESKGESLEAVMRRYLQGETMKS